MDKQLATLSGGHDIEVTMLDGTKEAVRVRQLAIRLMPKYLAIAEDESATVELFCDKPTGWADKLTPASFEEILRQGEEFNLDPLSCYAERVARRREKLFPGMTERFLAKLESASKSIAPESRSKPD